MTKLRFGRFKNSWFGLVVGIVIGLLVGMLVFGLPDRADGAEPTRRTASVEPKERRRAGPTTTAAPRRDIAPRSGTATTASCGRSGGSTIPGSR